MMKEIVEIVKGIHLALGERIISFDENSVTGTDFLILVEQINGIQRVILLSKTEELLLLNPISKEFYDVKPDYFGWDSSKKYSYRRVWTKIF